jgi:hypothetical protein
MRPTLRAPNLNKGRYNANATTRCAGLRTFHDVADLSLALRPLGSFEHLFWLIDQSHPVHFAVTAEVEGDISPRDWRQALNRVQDRHPLLNVSIEGANGLLHEMQNVLVEACG